MPEVHKNGSPKSPVEAARQSVRHRKPAAGQADDQDVFVLDVHILRLQSSVFSNQLSFAKDSLWRHPEARLTTDD